MHVIMRLSAKEVKKSLNIMKSFQILSVETPTEVPLGFDKFPKGFRYCGGPISREDVVDPKNECLILNLSHPWFQRFTKTTVIFIIIFIISSAFALQKKRNKFNSIKLPFSEEFCNESKYHGSFD